MDLVLLDGKVTETFSFLNSWFLYYLMLYFVIETLFCAVLVQMIRCPLSISSIYDLTMLILSLFYIVDFSRDFDVPGCCGFSGKLKVFPSFSEFLFLFYSLGASAGCYFWCTYETLSLDSIYVWKCIIYYFLFKVNSDHWSIGVHQLKSLWANVFILADTHVAILFIEQVKLRIYSWWNYGFKDDTQWRNAKKKINVSWLMATIHIHMSYHLISIYVFKLSTIRGCIVFF